MIGTHFFLNFMNEEIEVQDEYLKITELGKRWGSAPGHLVQAHGLLSTL